MKFSPLQLHKMQPPHLRSNAEILRDNLICPFHGLMLLCTIILLAVKAPIKDFFFLLLALLNVLLRIGYDISARNAVQRLSPPDRPHTVLRSKSVLRCERHTDLQPDDVLALSKGEIVPADSIILSGEVMTAESLLTGIGHAARKGRGDRIYAESRIEFGCCCARVLHAAEHSLAAHIANVAPPLHRRRTEIDRGIHTLILLLGSIAAPITLGKAILLVMHGNSIASAAAYAASMLTSMLPVMWLLMTSFSLFLGARTLRSANAAARDLYCVETLARADVICFDKTCTITRRTPDGGLREEIEALDFFHREGVTLKLLSGDSVESVAAVLQKTRLSGEVFNCHAAQHNDAELVDAAARYVGFANASAAQKAIIIRALRDAGHTVAMVGDGANDVAALRAADCSVSFGSGAAEARAAAQIVLLENHLSLLPAISLEGRRVINNITRTGELFVKKTLCSFVLYLLVLFQGFAYPFHTEHWTVLNLFCVIIPAAVLAMEQQHQKVHGRFLPNVLSEATPGAVLHILYIIAGVHLSARLGLTEPETLTLCCSIAAAAGLGVLWHICCFPLDRLRLLLCSTMTLLVPVALLLTGSMLHLAPPTGTMLLWALPFLLLAFPLMHLFVRAFAHIEHALQLPTHAAHTVHAKH